MSFEINKGKDFIYIIPVLAIIGFIYLMLYNNGDLEKPLEQVTNKITQEKSMENNTTEKVITTESGLQYEVITMGDGPKPEATDTVEVHYHGTLEDGTVFDSSVQRGETISFGLNQVIVGWTEGLQLMPVGSKFKFTIPADLAYGDASPSPLIPGGSTLVFEVELFGIK